MTARLHRRPWVPEQSEHLVQTVATETAATSADDVDAEIHRLVKRNRQIHDQECLNLNPATNVMNPRAEAALASGVGARPSLGYPGAKYEMGLEAIERIEIICAELAAEIFQADHAEIRVPSGAIANLYSFMACAEPGDVIIAPPATIGGHITHHKAGAAGLYRLDIRPAPIDATRYTVDLDALRALAKEVQPKVISIGASLNLSHHPVAEIRVIADEVGAKVLFDAAHLSGPIAGGAWPNPLAEGAHLMTMSTYKSLGGPPSGLIVTNDAALAERLDHIAYPGLTANFDAAKSASLAITLLDWREHGSAYAAAMCETAAALATHLQNEDVPVFTTDEAPTRSHAFAIDSAHLGGGHEAALKLREVNLLTCAIGLPTDTDAIPMSGLRLGTNEAVRWGMTAAEMPELAQLIARGLSGIGADATRADVTRLRSRFSDLHHIRA